MDSQNTKHKHCFKKAKHFIRQELQMDKFQITNLKIIRFCWEFQNDPEKVILQLRQYADRVRQVDLHRVQSLPKSHCMPSKSVRATLRREWEPAI